MPVNRLGIALLSYHGWKGKRTHLRRRPAECTVPAE